MVVKGARLGSESVARASGTEARPHSEGGVEDGSGRIWADIAASKERARESNVKQIVRTSELGSRPGLWPDAEERRSSLDEEREAEAGRWGTSFGGEIPSIAGGQQPGQRRASGGGVEVPNPTMSGVVEVLLGHLKDRLLDDLMDFDHNSVVRG